MGFIKCTNSLILVTLSDLMSKDHKLPHGMDRYLSIQLVRGIFHWDRCCNADQLFLDDTCNAPSSAHSHHASNRECYSHRLHIQTHIYIVCIYIYV